MTRPEDEFTSIKVREGVRQDLLSLQEELEMLGKGILPEDLRPESLGLGEIIAAGVKSLRKHLPKRRK